LVGNIPAHGDNTPAEDGAGQEEGGRNLGKDEPSGDLHRDITAPSPSVSLEGIASDANVPDKHGQDGVVVVEIVEVKVLAHTADFGIGNVVSVENIKLALSDERWRDTLATQMLTRKSRIKIGKTLKSISRTSFLPSFFVCKRRGGVSQNRWQIGQSSTHFFLGVSFETSLDQGPRVLCFGRNVEFLDIRILNHLDTRFAIRLHRVLVIHLGRHGGERTA
jgi:hypothetical protein